MKLSQYLIQNNMYDKCVTTGFSEELVEHIELGKRDNNNKRSFLFINEFQGKHKPVSPNKVRELANKMAEALMNSTQDSSDKVLVIGMAETALLLGELVANKLTDRYNQVVYLPTTRIADKKGETTINIVEQHSHNTDLMLNFSAIDMEYNSIVIVDDEVTTGNTLKSLISNLNKVVDLQKHHIYILSILNWTGKQIDTIDNIEFKYISLIGEQLDFNGKLRHSINIRNIHIKTNEEFFLKFQSQLKRYKSIQVIGVEEDMYTAFSLAEYLQPRLETNVKYRATTRSPIQIYGEIHNRYTITSPFTVLNEKTDKSYIYNLSEEDAYIVVMREIKNTEKRNNFFREIARVLVEYTGNVYMVMKEI